MPGMHLDSLTIVTAPNHQVQPPESPPHQECSNVRHKLATLASIPSALKISAVDAISSQYKIDLFDNIVETAFPQLDHLILAAWNVVSVSAVSETENPAVRKAILELKEVLDSIDAHLRGESVEGIEKRKTSSGLDPGSHEVFLSSEQGKEQIANPSVDEHDTDNNRENISQKQQDSLQHGNQASRAPRLASPFCFTGSDNEDYDSEHLETEYVHMPSQRIPTMQTHQPKVSSPHPPPTTQRSTHQPTKKPRYENKTRHPASSSPSFSQSTKVYRSSELTHQQNQFAASAGSGENEVSSTKPHSGSISASVERPITEGEYSYDESILESRPSQTRYKNAHIDDHRRKNPQSPPAYHSHHHSPSNEPISRGNNIHQSNDHATQQPTQHPDSAPPPINMARKETTLSFPSNPKNLNNSNKDHHLGPSILGKRKKDKSSGSSNGRNIDRTQVRTQASIQVQVQVPVTAASVPIAPMLHVRRMGMFGRMMDTD